jgi:hypothetical protein
MNADSLVAPEIGSTPHPARLEVGSRIYHFEQLSPHCLGYRFDVEAFRIATPAQLRAELDEVFKGDT